LIPVKAGGRDRWQPHDDWRPAMSQPACPDEDDLPPPREKLPPSVLVWTLAGFAVVLAYVALLALLRPSA
jgi:hypothetical protein